MQWLKQKKSNAYNIQFFSLKPLHCKEIFLTEILCGGCTSTKKKETMLSVEAEVTGHPHDAAERKWTLRGGIKVPCIYRFYGRKKNEVEFRNKLTK